MRIFNCSFRRRKLRLSAESRTLLDYLGWLAVMASARGWSAEQIRTSLRRAWTAMVRKWTEIDPPTGIRVASETRGRVERTLRRLDDQ